MKEKAQGIIDRGIDNFQKYYNVDTADYGLHVMIGKILLVAELELITAIQMDECVDRLFYEHKKLKKFSKN